MPHQRILIANGKRIVARSGRAGTHAAEAIVIAHGRFQLHSYFTGNANIPLPAGLNIYHYIHHTETFPSRTAMDQYLGMQYGNGTCIHPVKDYSNAKTVKNYTLRGDPQFSGLRVPEHAKYDLIVPQEIIRVSDLLTAAQAKVLPYTGFHFICCRAVRLSAAGLL
jgi:hypothetical protein